MKTSNHPETGSRQFPAWDVWRLVSGEKRAAKLRVAGTLHRQVSRIRFHLPLVTRTSWGERMDIGSNTPD